MEGRNSLLTLFYTLLNELGETCCVHKRELEADYKTVRSRFEDEGFGFLAIALPAFCADFERSLSEGQIGNDLFTGFRRSKGGLPSFLRGFLSLVFDGTARLRDVPDYEAIRAIRQLTLVFGKMKTLPSEKRQRQALQSYITTDEEVKTSLESVDPEDLRLFDEVVQSLYHRGHGSNSSGLFERTAFGLESGALVGRHGPGGTADSLRGNAKWRMQWKEDFEYLFPYVDYVLPSLSHWETCERVTFESPGTSTPVKVVLVPKTAKSARVIAMEPTHVQYMQQGLSRDIVSKIKSDVLLSGLIGFDDQAPNQALARVGSIDGSLATLDLSEASDRLSLCLVERVFRRSPVLLEALRTLRTPLADVPGVGIIPLQKYASMGSALTFPVEAIVFLAIAITGVAKSEQRTVDSAFLNSLEGRVRVYGDDIVVPTRSAQTVASLLESFGLKVNTRKSFWTGKFRESCGREYFEGYDVSIHRLRNILPRDRTDVSEAVSLVSFRNQVYWAGLWNTASLIDGWIRELGIPYPVLSSTSPGIGRESVLGYTSTRMCSRYHRPLVRAMVLRTQKYEDPLDGPHALTKWFTTRGEEPLDVDHLRVSVRSGSLTWKSRWVVPY